MRSIVNRMVVAGLLGSLASAAPLEAQERSRADRERMTREEMQERVRERYEERLARVLDLSAEQRDGLREVLEGFRESRRDLMPRRRELHAEARAFLAAGGDDDDRARRILEGLEGLRRDELRIREDEQARLLELLSPSQVLRMEALRQEFGERVRRLEMGRMGMRARPPGAAWRGAGAAVLSRRGPPGLPWWRRGPHRGRGGR